MSDQFNVGRTKPWNMYSSTSPNPSTDVVNNNKEAQWKSLGSSMNAISFGFVATAILISMFLIMAIFEHLFRPNADDHDDNNNSGGIESRDLQKIAPPEIVQTLCASDYSVVMPGQKYPTFIAQPAPLPCPRERVLWPPHQHSIIDCP